MKIVYDNELANALADIGLHFSENETMTKEEYSLILEGCGLTVELENERA